MLFDSFPRDYRVLTSNLKPFKLIRATCVGYNHVLAEDMKAKWSGYKERVQDLKAQATAEKKRSKLVKGSGLGAQSGSGTLGKVNGAAGA